MEYYLSENGETIGPLAVERLHEYVRSGIVTPSTFVWFPGASDWMRAESVAELQALFAERRGGAATTAQNGARTGKTPASAFADHHDRSAQASTNAADSLTGRLPLLEEGRVIDIEQVRDSKEGLYLGVIYAVNVLFALVLAVVAINAPLAMLGLAAYALLIFGLLWIGWKLTCARLLAHAVEVGPAQYPLIHDVVSKAARVVGVPAPRVYVLQGDGLFEIFVSKFLRDPGFLLITSALLDEIVKRPSSRELMMYVGRQLGHIRAGHFDGHFFKRVIGSLAGPFYLAWLRHGHLTADRIGLLCAGDLHAAEQGLLMVTVGPTMAEVTQFEPLRQQRERLEGSFWAWIANALSGYPPMVTRLVKLRDYALALGMQARTGTQHLTVGAVPLRHTYLRPVPLLLIHGHDRLALLELQNYLLEQYPFIAPRLMVSETHGTLGMSEKFDRVASEVVGAVALFTPDDTATAVAAQATGAAQWRARQNVVLEVGWAWGRLGRERFLLLKRGDIELPSDLSGADVQTFHHSPAECARALQAFVDGLVQRHRYS